MDDMHLDKTNRILFLYTKLLQGQLLIKSELAQLTGVNEKSIQRDLEDIRDFLDKRRIEEGYGSQLIYDYREKGYCLEQSSQLRLSNDEVLAISILIRMAAIAAP